VYITSAVAGTPGLQRGELRVFARGSSRLFFRVGVGPRLRLRQGGASLERPFTSLIFDK